MFRACRVLPCALPPGSAVKMKLPGRKGLDDICRLDLLEHTPPIAVAAVWTEHHKHLIQYWGRCISTAAYEALRPRLVANPYFVIPIFRDKGLFNVVSNYKDDLIGVCPLGEWQKKQDHANIHMTIQFFTELSRSKNLVLVRTELQDQHLTRSDSIFAVQMIMKYYTHPTLFERYVETFNKRPNQFDYHQYLRAMREEAGGDKPAIRIEDKKSEIRSDAYGPRPLDLPPGFTSSIIRAADPARAQPASSPDSGS